MGGSMAHTGSKFQRIGGVAVLVLALSACAPPDKPLRPQRSNSPEAQASQDQQELLNSGLLYGRVAVLNILQARQILESALSPKANGPAIEVKSPPVGTSCQVQKVESARTVTTQEISYAGCTQQTTTLSGSVSGPRFQVPLQSRGSVKNFYSIEEVLQFPNYMT